MLYEGIRRISRKHFSLITSLPLSENLGSDVFPKEETIRPLLERGAEKSLRPDPQHTTQA